MKSPSATWLLMHPDGGFEATHIEPLFEQIIRSGVGDPVLYATLLQWRVRELAAMGLEQRCFSVVQSVQVGSGDGLVFDAPALRLHHVLGAPVLPGQGLKGMCRAEAEDLLRGETEAERESELAQVFGAADRQGQWRFEDAWWVPEGIQGLPHRGGPFDLERDTPEEKEWHQSCGEKNVRLKGSPEPVPRLVATGSFVFWLDTTQVPPPERAEVTKGAWQLLTRALRVRGQGARKNYDDYGRFEPVAAP